MTTATKRSGLVGLIVLLVGITLFVLPRAGGPRYRTESCVLAQPYTNVLFARAFEAHVVQTLPGVLRLRVTPAFRAIPGSAARVLTNGVAIHIIAVAPTAHDAEHAANDAATRLCKTVLTNYGVTGQVMEHAVATRRYSFLHDSFQPAVARLFQR